MNQIEKNFLKKKKEDEGTKANPFQNVKN